MSPRIARVVFTVALGYTLALAPVLLADDEKSDSPKLAERPDWSGYITVTDVIGEIVEADDKKIVLRVTWYVPEVKRTNNNNKNRNVKNRNQNNKNRNAKNNNRNRRPNLNGNNRNFRNPYAKNNNRPQIRVTYKEQHDDYTLEYVPQSLVRTKTLPQQIDLDGDPKRYTREELAALRAPAGYPGYAAARADVKSNAIVYVVLVRDRKIPAALVKENDLRVKYVQILGKNLNPKRDDSKKKKKK